MSRSAASRISSRVPAGFILSSLDELHYCTIWVFRAIGKNGGRQRPVNASPGVQPHLGEHQIGGEVMLDESGV
jgi:hypothetical protein